MQPLDSCGSRTGPVNNVNRTQPGSFVCVLSLAAFTLHPQSAVATTEAAWPQKLKISPIRSFTDNVCPHLHSTSCFNLTTTL